MRGQISLGMNMMTALIIGIVLFVFLAGFSWTLMKNANEEQARLLAFRVENEFLYAQNEENLVREIVVPEEDMENICRGEDVVDISAFRISGVPYIRGMLMQQPLFSTSELYGPTLQVFARTWSAPMGVGTFLFLDDTRTQFVFVSDGQPWVTTLAGLFEPFKIRVIRPSQLPALAPAERYRFVLFSGTVSDIPSRFYDSSSAVIVYSTDKGLSGTLSFYEDLSTTIPSLSTEYYGEPLLLGAIFSGSSSMYTCNMLKAEGLLDTSILVAKERIRLLRPDYAQCSEYYDQADAFLDEYSVLGVNALRVNAVLFNEIGRTNAALANRQCPTLY